MMPHSNHYQEICLIVRGFKVLALLQNSSTLLTAEAQGPNPDIVCIFRCVIQSDGYILFYLMFYPTAVALCNACLKVWRLGNFLPTIENCKRTGHTKKERYREILKERGRETRTAWRNKNKWVREMQQLSESLQFILFGRTNMDCTVSVRVKRFIETVTYPLKG